MRSQRFAVLLLLVFVSLAAGCNSNNEGVIEGTRWSCLSAQMRGKNVPGVAGKLRITFSKNGKVSYVTPEGIFDGTYSLSMGDYVTLDFDRPLGGLTQHAQRVSVDGNKMTMTDSDGTSAVFGLLSRE